MNDAIITKLLDKQIEQAAIEALELPDDHDQKLDEITEYEEHDHDDMSGHFENYTPSHY